MSQTGHEITLTEAKDITISGVENVQSATATAISATTTCGGMVIKGKNIHVEKLDLEQKVLIATELYLKIFLFLYHLPKIR